MYLTQSTIGDNPYMKQRVAQCAAQQGVTDVGIDPDVWATEWRRVWSTSPGWDDAWESALADPTTRPVTTRGWTRRALPTSRSSPRCSR